MELKAGYKRTEIGIIPEEWKVCDIDSITSLVGDGLHGTPKYANNGEYYFVNGNNLINGMVLVNEQTKRVDTSEYLKHRKSIGDNTIFLSINGTIGSVAFYRGEPIVLGKSVAFLNFKIEISKKYVFFSLQTSAVKQRFEGALTGSTIKNLGLGAIRKTSIALPGNPIEQTAIANALNDADALIQSLQKLIAKKRQIKQGAMQTLLKGRNRLPEFKVKSDYKHTEVGTIPADWLVSKFGDIVNKISSGKSSTVSRNGEYPIYGSTGIIGWQQYFDYSGEKILVARVGANAGTVNKVAGKYCVSDNTLMISYGKNIDICFSFFQLISFKLNTLVFGSGQPLITGGQLKNISIALPPSIAEQTAIAKILSDMDVEIAALETKLAKYQDIKQGMMQNLLTGRIRLV